MKPRHLRYRSSRKPISRTPRKAPKTRGKLGKVFAFVKLILIIAAVGTLLYILFFTRLFEIQKIEITAENSTVEQRALINEQLQSELGKNMLFLNTSKTETALKEQLPEVKNIKINRKLLHTLNITLEPFQDIANIKAQLENDTEEIYIVNELGEISSQGLLNEDLPTIIMQNSSVDEEESLVTQETLQTLLGTSTSFEGKFNMKVLEIHYLKQARELHLLTDRYFFVWIDLTQDIPTQLAKLKKAMTELNIYNAELEYIDLRISGQGGEKVIYK